MIRWLICKLWGHKVVVKAYTGETMQASNGLGQLLTVPMYRWERRNFCCRCGHVPPWATVNTPASSTIVPTK